MDAILDAKQRLFWILGTFKSTTFWVDRLYLKTYVWIPYLCLKHVWLGNYNQNIKTAAILAAILDFGHLQKLKHLTNVSGRFLIPQNICLDTLLVFLVCVLRKLWSKYENGGHFGRHLGFWRMPRRNFQGLFISDSTHIPGPILKKSAHYQKCPLCGLYGLILLGYKTTWKDVIRRDLDSLMMGWTLEKAEVAVRDRKIWGHFLHQVAGASMQDTVWVSECFSW